MADLVWHRVDRELQKRRAQGKLPNSWAALGRTLGTSAQVLTNWKSRGVPPKSHADIAAALDWSVDELLGLEDAPDEDVALDADAEEFAARYQALSPEARAKMRMLLYVVMDGKQPAETWRAPNAERRQPDQFLGGDSGLTELDAPIRPAVPTKKTGKK